MPERTPDTNADTLLFWFQHLMRMVICLICEKELPRHETLKRLIFLIFYYYFISLLYFYILVFKVNSNSNALPIKKVPFLSEVLS